MSVLHLEGFVRMDLTGFTVPSVLDIPKARGLSLSNLFCTWTSEEVEEKNPLKHGSSGQGTI